MFSDFLIIVAFNLNCQRVNKESRHWNTRGGDRKEKMQIHGVLTQQTQSSEVLFTPVDQPDCSSDPERTSRFCSADCWLELQGKWTLPQERIITERRQRTRTRTRTRVSAECWLHSELHLDSNRNTLHAARPLTADVQWSYLAGWVAQIITSDPVVKPSLLVLNTLINIHSCCGS